MKHASSSVRSFALVLGLLASSLAGCAAGAPEWQLHELVEASRWDAADAWLEIELGRTADGSLAARVRAGSPLDEVASFARFDEPLPLSLTAVREATPLVPVALADARARLESEPTDVMAIATVSLLTAPVVAGEDVGTIQQQQAVSGHSASRCLARCGRFPSDAEESACQDMCTCLWGEDGTSWLTCLRRL